jgi:hypothetical protein
LAALSPGDLVKLAIKGRHLYGEVTEVKDGVVFFRPLCPGAGWRHASAREVIGHWRKSGRRRAADGDELDEDSPPPVPREQLSLKVNR